MKAYTKDGALFLEPEGDLAASRVEELRNFLMAQLKACPGEKTVILDVAGINVVDSLGVNLIIGLYKHVSADSKTFRIINAEDTFMKVADIFRFPSLFTIESR